MARITCFDGVGCIGGNKILLEDGGTRLWFDFGIDFGRKGKFYEEFLTPKSCTGLYEPVRMGLLPLIPDLYRDDLLCGLAYPWDGLAARPLGDVHGVLVSHAHTDHIGCLPYLRADIPIYASAMSIATAKAMQDSGAGGIESQYCYMTPYEPSETGELKSSNYTRTPSTARPFILVDEAVSPEFARFWSSTPGSESARGRKHESVPLGLEETCGGLRIKRFPVDHSVYGACAWAVETGSGWVVYTGDLRCHGANAHLTWKFAEEAAKLKPVALVIEGTRIDNDSTSTEGAIAELALSEVARAKGLVVADFGPRNVERLNTFFEIAKATGRKLLILQKDAYLLQKMALAGAPVPPLDHPNIAVYYKYEASTKNWKKLLPDTLQVVQPW
ncbi:MAG: MBL fold metallo-hydrolase, partial [Armatimonadota bacterium]